LPSSEDYVVVWAGTYHRVRAGRASADRLHELQVNARKAGLRSWRDTFEWDAVTGPIECVLIGRLVAVLGWKEGRFRVELGDARVKRTLRAVEARLRRVCPGPKVRIHVLFHVEDVDD
jgi:hypothetical protein